MIVALDRSCWYDSAAAPLLCDDGLRKTLGPPTDAERLSAYEVFVSGGERCSARCLALATAIVLNSGFLSSLSFEAEDSKFHSKSPAKIHNL